MTKISSIIDDEVSKFEWKVEKEVEEKERIMDKSKDFMFAAGLRGTDKGEKWERVRPLSAKPIKKSWGNRFKICYEYG